MVAVINIASYYDSHTELFQIEWYKNLIVVSLLQR